MTCSNVDTGSWVGSTTIVNYGAQPAGSYVFYAKATSMAFYIFKRGSGTAAVGVDNISVREVKDGMTGYLLEDDGSEILLAQ